MPIAISRADGGVSIMTVMDGADADAEIVKWKTANPGAYVSHAEVEAVPTDRTFRDSWKPDLTVDLDKAKAKAKEAAPDKGAEIDAAQTVDALKQVMA